MYGLIGCMKALAGRRDELIGILLHGTQSMPGCLNYVIARDANDHDLIWIHEAWVDEAAHQASLQLPEVKAAIAQGRSLIAEFVAQHVTEPVGGAGLITQP